MPIFEMVCHKKLRDLPNTHLPGLTTMEALEEGFQVALRCILKTK